MGSDRDLLRRVGEIRQGVACADCGFSVRNAAVSQGARWSEYDGDWLCPTCVNRLSVRERQVADLMRTRERQVQEHLEREAFGAAIERQLVEPIGTQLYGHDVLRLIPDDVGDLTAIAFAAWRVVGLKVTVSSNREYEAEPHVHPCLWAAEILPANTRQTRFDMFASDALKAVEQRTNGLLDRADRSGFVVTERAEKKLKTWVHEAMGAYPSSGLPTEWRPPNR